MGAKKSKNTHNQGPVDRNLKAVSCGTVESYKPNEIKEIKVTSDFSVLVSEFEGTFYAYGSKCPHYGAPLIKGRMVGNVVKCAWHGAAFDIRSGDIEDYPGSGDCIPTYQVNKSKQGELTVYISEIGKYRIQRPMQILKDKAKLYICVGGGPASITFAQTLRENNYDGRILIICKESVLPYDRTKLSKALASSWPDLKLKDEKWFSDNSVEFMLNTTCTSVDMDKKELTVEGQKKEETIAFNNLLIATGVRPRVPAPNAADHVEGVDCKNVLTLYTIKDSVKIKEKATGKNVVIQGSGFVAMELVSNLSPIAKTITIVSWQKRPYRMIFGDTVGRVLHQHIQSKHKNIEFFGYDSIRKIFPNAAGEVIKVKTFKDKEFPCDLMIYAIGGVPNSEMFQNNLPFLQTLQNDSRKIRRNPLDILPTGHINVNEYMETNIKGLWAAGDIVRFPLHTSVLGLANSGHWGMAQKMGRIAALSMLGKKQSISNTIPYFWTTVAGLILRYVGYGEHYNKSLIFGNLESLKFCVIYKRDSTYLAGLTSNCDPIASQLCFDLQDNTDYSESYPTYIVEQFPDPPIVGNTSEGIKFQTEEFTFTHRTRQKWLPGATRVHDDNFLKDKDFAIAHHQ